MSEESDYADDFILRAAEELEQSRSSDAPRRLVEEVREVVAKRGSMYGHPSEHFARTVGMVNALFAHKLREPLTIEDWPLVMICDKLARHQEKPQRDNIVDAAGYAECWDMCWSLRDGAK